MEIYERLKQDHDELRDLFAKIDQPEELQTFGREQLFEDIKLKLVAHDQAEEDTWYDAVINDRNLHGLVEEGKKDHDEIISLLSKVASIPSRDDRWLDSMRDVRTRFLHHVQEEEQKMFPRSRNILAEDRAEDIGRRFNEEELRLMADERRGLAH